MRPQPLGDRLAADVGDDRRFPSPFGEAVRLAERRHLLGEPIPAARDAAPARCCGRPRPSGRTKPQPPRRIRVSSRPSSAASFWISSWAPSIRSAPPSACWPSLKPSADRPGAAADAVARFDDRDGRAEGGQVPRRREPGEPCARHQNRHTVQRRHAPNLRSDALRQAGPFRPLSSRPGVSGPAYPSPATEDGQA